MSSQQTLRFSSLTVLVLLSLAGVGTVDAARPVISSMSLDVSLPARAAISTALGYDNAVYHARATVDGYRMRNPTQDLVATFTSDGMTIGTAGRRWGLRLTAYGYGSLATTAPTAMPHADANRVAYKRETLTE